MPKLSPQTMLRKMVKAQGVRKVADKLYWQPSKISRWLSEERGMSFDDAVDLARAVGCRVVLLVPGQTAEEMRESES